MNRSFNAILILLTVAFFVNSCGDQHSEIREEFERINNAIDVSSGISARSTDSVYKSIIADRSIPNELKAKADSIYLPARAAHLYIEQLKRELLLTDSVGDSLDVADKLIRQTVVGDSLEIKLLKVRDAAYVALADPMKKGTLDTILHDISNLPNVDWKKMYFRQTPTIAALTVLNKFVNDCRDASLTSLHSIKNAIKR